MIAALTGVSLLCLVGFVVAEDKAKSKDQKVKCPVAGKEILVSKGKAVAYKGANVYVCCDGCKAKLAKDTKKHAVKLNHQLVATGQFKQAKCPLGGRPVNKAQSVSVAGVKVGLCCGRCKGALAKAEGDAQLALAFSDKAFTKGFVAVKKKK